MTVGSPSAAPGGARDAITNNRSVGEAPVDPQSSVVASSTNPRFRSDIDGLRAVAVLLVVFFHAGVGGFEGGFVGVDVFFVISGFLITQGLLREHDRSSRIDVIGFWLRRARRLLPAAGIVIAVTLVAQLALRSPLDWDTAIDEAFAAATYWSNEALARFNGGYFGPVENRPLLHTWSLSVEEQFYLVWPLLFVVLVTVVKDKGRRLALWVTLVASVSLLFSISMTRAGEPAAYLSAISRSWEFAAGAVLAIASWSAKPTPSCSTVPRWRRHGLTWLGILGVVCIVFSALVVREGQGFPWPFAIAPVAGTLALIAAHPAPTSTLGRLLGSAAMQQLGRLSYVWYLWHWPVLVLGRDVVGSSDVLTSLGLVVVGLGLAYLTHRFVENPLRHRRAASRSREVVAAAVVPLGLTVLVIGAAAAYRAEVMSDDFVSDIDAASEGYVTHLSHCFSSFEPGFDERCTFGDEEGSRLILVVGDSHAAHWMPMFDSFGRTHGVRVVALQLGSCPVLVPAAIEGEHAVCPRLRSELTSSIDQLEPDLVVTGLAEAYVERPEGLEGWRQGHADFAGYLESQGVGLIVMHDIGRWPDDPLQCLLDNRDRRDVPGLCGLARDAVEDHRAPVAVAEANALAAAGHGVTFDPLPLLCDEQWCNPVSADGQIIMQDSHHVTRDFAVGLATEMAPVLLPLLD